MALPDEQMRKEAQAALERMQTFDPGKLPRETELGSLKNFQAAVDPATRLVQLYRRLTVVALEDFPQEKLQHVRDRANADFNLFDQVLKFDPDRSTAERDSIVNQLVASYQQTFNILHPLIAYSLHRSADFQRLDTDARSTIQGIRDQSAQITKDLEKAKVEAARILEEVRETAAESGVTQQAIYFKEAAEGHDGEALKWYETTKRLAWALGVYAILSLAVHELPFLRPDNAFEAIQLGVSKVLLFAGLTFMLYLAARNFLSNKHNAIVNRHRQNALLTYRTMVDAALDSPNRDVILTHASACIFSPQPTGYSGDGQGGPATKSIVEMLTRPLEDTK